MLLRSFLVQGSWNYRTLIGTGMAFVLVPALRHLYADDPEGLRAALGRHAELFNSHPYLAGMAAGAVARLEAEKVPAETVARFKNAVRGSLGSLGDRVVWLMWRPACALLMVALVLAGVAWWAAVLAFLVVYNALHFWIRVRGLDMGLDEGLRVARVIRETPFERVAERAGNVGALLAGFAAVLALGWAGDAFRSALLLLGPAALAAGILLGPRIRWVAAVALIGVLAAGLLAGNP
jgi:mannose PTS system EIID component